MKKIFILLLALCCCTAVSAQKRITTTTQVDHNLEGSSPPENNGFGIKGGLIISSLQGDQAGRYPGLDKQKSYHAGLYSQFSITNNFSVQPEVLYTRKGFKYQDTDLRLDYFDVPVLASLRVLDNVSLLLGPQVSVLMTVKENDREMDKEFYNSFDYGAVGGIEARLSFLRLGARYVRSFENIYKTGHLVGSQELTDVQHSNLQFYIGAGF
ncbi:MAG: porin family protein [Adhaeribacter sp.]